MKRNCSNTDMIAVRSKQYASRLEVWLCLHWCMQARCVWKDLHQWRTRRAAPPPLSTWQIDPEHPDCVQQYSCPATIPSAVLCRFGRSLSIMSLPLATSQSTSDSCRHPYSPTAEQSLHRKKAAEERVGPIPLLPAESVLLWGLQRTSKSFSLRNQHKKTGSTPSWTTPLTPAIRGHPRPHLHPHTGQWSVGLCP